MYRRYFKRPMDIVLSLIGIIGLSPVLLIVAILVKIKLGSPVIFKQDRPGLNEKIFTMYKFRTMTDEKDENGNLLSDGIRLTKFGQLLRSTSLDELPELWNILKGDMSVIGPRPLLIEYLPRYNERQKKRHLVRPGLSGLAQIGGRNAINWEEKFDCDIKYVDNISFVLDWQIILKTILKTVKREGINKNDQISMEKFMGSRMKKTLVIIGASGHGKVVADIALKMNTWKDVVFLDDNKNLSSYLGIKVEGSSNDINKYKREAEFFVAIGNSNIREKVLENLISEDYDIATLVHPKSIIGLDVKIRCGTAIMAGAIVNSSTRIGKGVIINTGSTIDHDNMIENYVHVSPGVNIAGCVTIKEKAWVGIGSSIIQGIKIGKNVLIGAGAVVTKNIDDNKVAYGNPIKIIRNNEI